MPVPLNAATEIVRTHLTKRLHYLADDSIPIKIGKGPLSDIDFIARRPIDKVTQVVSLLGKQVELSPNLVIEVKGWLDYSQPWILKWLEAHLDAMKGSRYLNAGAVTRLKKREDGMLAVLSKEVFEFANQTFGGDDFQRVIVLPLDKVEAQSKYQNRINQVLITFSKKDVVILDIVRITDELIALLKEKEKRAHFDPRKNFVLELLYFLEYARKSNNLSNLSPHGSSTRGV